jgi:hypothetical protein
VKVEHAAYNTFESESIQPQVNRVKVVDKNGNVLDYTDIDGIRILVQDGGETLKVVLL